MSSPAQKLIDKLLSKQQSSDASSASSPLILFQYSNHVSLREGAATRSSSTPHTSRSRVQQQQDIQNAKLQAEADLYRRAQLRTPAENARRATWGGPLWVQYLTRELINQSRHGLLWVSTTARPIPQWIDSPRVSIVSASFLYQTILENSKDMEQHPLAVLLDRIQEKITQDPDGCTPIVIESIVPLVQLCGFFPALTWIQKLLALPHTLLLLPILSETLSSLQHQQFEDLAHTALWLSGHTGQVDLHVLRRGIREQDNTVREIWDFSLQPSSEHLYTLIVGKDAATKVDSENSEQLTAPHQVNLLEAMNPALNPDARPAPDPVAIVSQQTKKITLKMEDENTPLVRNKANAAPSSNAPRIFLQDDDPEFEDYDEEDPDDDLDI